MLAALSGALLGIASGVRHAMEPDHLAAVSTFVAEQKTPRGSVAFAMAWGAGHALMLVGVGFLVLLLVALRSPVPAPDKGEWATTAAPREISEICHTFPLRSRVLNGRAPATWVMVLTKNVM